ncbi:MAG: MotA/TolQ/ExbB proton channel family protein, partial [Pseudomonadota bacterium]
MGLELLFAQAASVEAAAETVSGVAAETVAETAGFDGAVTLLGQGGPVLWLIFVTSIFTLAVILYKLACLYEMRAWESKTAEKAVEAWSGGDTLAAKSHVAQSRGLRAKLVNAAMEAARAFPHDEQRAREETARVAKNLMAEATANLRALDVVATLAPLLGLLGTVLGMIAAFQALQASGAQADPATLAGGIWEALLTTAAGMAVAIPAAAALSFFEGTAEQIRLDFEDLASRVFNRPAALSAAR